MFSKSLRSRSPARLRTVALAAAALCAALVGACGSTRPHVPDLAVLPLPPATRIYTQIRSCNPGRSAYCALDLVLVGAADRYATPVQVFDAEEAVLHRRRWEPVYADYGLQYAELSPGKRWRVIFAPDDHTLRLIDLGDIQRPRALALALSRALFARLPAISLVLEFGPG
jgi:hypothetical protein